MGAIVTSGRADPSRSARLRSLLSTTATGDVGREPASRLPRGARDWIADAACFVIAIGCGILATSEPYLQDGAQPSTAATILIVVAGALACLALWLRRRSPVGVAIVAVALGILSPAAAGASLVALFSLAIRRPPVVVLAIAALATVGLPLYYSLHPDDLPFWVNIALSAGIQAAAVGWGMFIRSRRELMLSLRERTRQAEAERDLRVRQARAHERTRIAREMHDVLAHRLSLLSVHAGALEVHPDAPPEEIARAARVVRASAHQALDDLREVIDVLRAEPGGSEQRRPQPTLADVADLVDESRAAGTAVEFEQRFDPSRTPAATGRTVYRIVQEGLTNAHKHAPGASIQTTIDGAPGSGLTVEVISRQPLAELGRAEIPGSGAGLVGLEERVSLSGGRLEHGRTNAGDYRLWAWLPWPA